MALGTVKAGVYKITNLLYPECFYIGSSANVASRFSAWRHSFRTEMKYRCLLWDAVQKYGIENFSFELIEQCERKREVLEDREQFYLDSLRPVYNTARVAHAPPLDREPWNKGIPNPEHQALMTSLAAEANRGIARPEDVRQKISETRKTSDACKVWTDARRGVPRSDELKQKVSVGILASEKFQASVKARIGRARADNTSGHYGIVWDKSRDKWMVRVNKRNGGRFVNLDDAIKRRDAMLG